MQDEEEEEKRGVELSDDENRPDDDSVGGVDGKTKEHHGNARFDGHIGEDVDRFTRPPPFQANGNFRGGMDFPNVLTGAMVRARDGESTIDDEKDPGRDCKPVIQREVLQHEDSTVSPQYDGHGGQSKEEGVDSHHLKSMASRLNGHFGKPFLIEVLHWY